MYFIIRTPLVKFGSQIPRNDQDVRKLALCVCYCVLVCSFVYMCSLESKIFAYDPRIYRDIIKIKTSGYDSLGTTLHIPKEDPNFGKISCQWMPDLSRGESQARRD